MIWNQDQLHLLISESVFSLFLYYEVRFMANFATMNLCRPIEQSVKRTDKET